MAILASLRQSQSQVTGIVGFLKIREVTADARRRCPFVLSTHVAGRAVEGCMHAGQWKIRWRPSMVERRP